MATELKRQDRQDRQDQNRNSWDRRKGEENEPPATSAKEDLGFF
jgi:hypothetical protein